MLWLQEQWSEIQGFLNSGGPILLVIAGVAFVMWTFIFDRIWYYKGGLKRDVQRVIDQWEGRSERKSWHAHKIRQKLIAEISEKVNNNNDLIATLAS